MLLTNSQQSLHLPTLPVLLFVLLPLLLLPFICVFTSQQTYTQVHPLDPEELEARRQRPRRGRGR